MHGLARADAAEALKWFTAWATTGLVTITLPFDAPGAVAAGRLRAACPTPPTTGTRRAGTRPEQRAGWVLDLQIAACAWVHGHAIMTANRRDFAAIAALLLELYPGTPALEVLDPPM